MKQKESRKYGVPALLSFFVPSLGQFVKGDWKSGLRFWGWFILGNILIIGSIMGYGSLFSLKFLNAKLVAFLLAVIFNIVLWVYQIYDAYNSPTKEEG